MPKVRCHYDESLGLDFARVVEQAVGREAGGAGTGICKGRRDMIWAVDSEADADELRERLASCPEVTIVETTDG